MIDTKELRRLAQAATPGPWYVGSGIYEGRNIYSVVSVTDAEGFTYQPVVATVEDNDTQLWSENTSFIAAANPAAINELLSRLEEAESECLEQARLNGMGSEREAALMAKLEAAEKDIAVKEEVIDSLAAVVKRLDAQCDAAERERDECNRRRLEAADHFAAQTALMKEQIEILRAEVERMEQQEPVGTTHAMPGASAFTMACFNASDVPVGTKLYALPGAQTQPAPNAVAYLDLGVGGYMDIGTDLTDEELATLPKGRHMLGIIGTYGVDGYVPVQPAPSVQDVPAKSLKPVIDWLRNGCDPMKAADELELLIAAAAPEVKP